MSYICKCGNKSQISFRDFKRGSRCAKCGGTEKHTLEYVKSYFKEQGCICLATEYRNNRTKIPYICKCGEISNISFSHFKRGQRCYKCKESKGEKVIALYLKENNIIHKREWRFYSCRNKKPLPFDFVAYINKKIFIIEYQGEHHYEPRRNSNAKEKFINTIKHDEIKIKWCKENNIPLLIIPHWDKNNIDEKLNNFLKIQKNDT